MFTNTKNLKKDHFLKPEFKNLEKKIQDKLKKKIKNCFENSYDDKNFENCLLPFYKNLTNLETGFGSIFAFTEIYSKKCLNEFEHEEYCKDTTRDMFTKKIDNLIEELDH